ncbi:MAG: hypothetical protein LBL95_07890, partial [Deltaproteobacteria bacterium]|nr:hypothetical protein [Deltaproteobacteria bacterium]
RLIEEEIGPKACFRLRTVLMWYTRELPGAAALRAAICREEDIDAQLDLLRGAMEGAMEAEAGLTPEPPTAGGSLFAQAAPKGGVDSKGQVG